MNVPSDILRYSDLILLFILPPICLPLSPLMVRKLLLLKAQNTLEIKTMDSNGAVSLLYKNHLL